jgi:uncharacterized protein
MAAFSRAVVGRLPDCAPVDVPGRGILGAAGLLAATGGAVLGYAHWEARQYTLRDVSVSLGRPGAAVPALRILHLSDLHLSPRDTDRIAWVRDLARLAPDLTVITGDFHGDPTGPALALEALGPLLERPGAYVRGSNDYYAPSPANPLKYFQGPSELRTKRAAIDTAPLDEGLAAAGWHDLDNARAVLEVAGWRIDARGVDDPHIRRDRYAMVAGPFDAAADLRLGVAHAPYRRVLDAMAADGADLILAGHTHGGQVCLPAVGALVTNCDLPRAQAKGLSRWDGAALHVSAGLGTSPFTPIRLACRPEATLLHLA